METLPVNLEKAEFILSLYNKKNGFKTMMIILRELEDQYDTRLKQNRQFVQAVSALKPLYLARLGEYHHQLSQIQFELNQKEQQTHRLIEERTLLEQEVDSYEQQLSETREYAEQRRNKKSKRERQYHQLYHVPLIASQYKNKYIRARDKNAQAEAQVSDVRSNLDACQDEIAAITKACQDIKQQQQDLRLKYEAVESQRLEDQHLLTELDQAVSFFSNFDRYQLITAQKATTDLIESIQHHIKHHSSLQSWFDPQQNFIKVFQLALLEYGEAEKLMTDRWESLEVEFGCNKCKESQKGWPKLDKVRKDLLCEVCYRESHTSMVLEKKINGIKDRSHQLLSLPGSSMHSISSISSDNSSQKSNSSSLKKMVNLFKPSNKRNSSANSVSTYNTIDSPIPTKKSLFKS